MRISLLFLAFFSFLNANQCVPVVNDQNGDNMGGTNFVYRSSNQGNYSGSCPSWPLGVYVNEYGTGNNAKVFSSITPNGDNCYIVSTSYKYQICEIPPCEPEPQPESPYVLFNSYTGQQACYDAMFENKDFGSESICWHNTCSSDDIDNIQHDLYIIPFDETTCKPPLLLTGDGIFKKCLSPDDPNADLDGDGEPNKSDPDDDGDGITDGNDPDHPDYSGTTKGCLGKDTNDFVYYPSYPTFNVNEYEYTAALTNMVTCQSSIDGNTVDSVIVYDDLSDSCERDYCYQHRLDCSYTAADRIPPGFIYKSDIKSEGECLALVDGETYSSAIWDTVLSCPNVAFCFVQKASNSGDSGGDTSPGDDNSDDQVDLNSTTQDNQALLDGINKANENLNDIKDNIDTTNDKLDSANNTLDNIATSNKDINRNLEYLSRTTSKIASNQDMINDSLTNINNNIINQSDTLRAMNTNLNNVDKNIDNVNSNLLDMHSSLHESLFGDDPFSNVDFTDDGSDTFGSLVSDAESSFSITTETNILGLSSISGGSLPTYSFNLYGKTITIFEPSMLSSLPIDQIRALLLFMFALLGFAQTFRST